MNYLLKEGRMVHVDSSCADNSAGRDDSDCHCPPSCDNVAYDSTVSSSHLSNLIVKSILGVSRGQSQRGDPDVRRRFLRAAEIRGRVDAEQMGSTIGRLEKLRTALDRLRAVLDVDVVNVDTSMTGQLLEAVGALVQRTATSIANFKLKIVDRFSTVYNRRANFLVDQLTNSANTFVIQVDEYLELQVLYRGLYTGTLVHGYIALLCTSSQDKLVL